LHRLQNGMTEVDHGASFDPEPFTLIPEP